ncbi:MAG: DHH family phosphoesterase [Patescibacteria group bacterium]|jgi:phosphoesterase RecJ-like protein
MSNSKEKIDSFIQTAKSIVVTSHLSPDPDALGSALGVWFYIKNNFPDKKVKVVFEGLPAKLGSFLSGFSEITWTTNLSMELKDADLIFFVDGSLFSRFTSYPKEIDFQKLLTVCIDHHPEPVPDPFTLRLCDTVAAATSQQVAEIFFDGGVNNVTPEVAEVLLVGIIGDTGNFRFIDPSKTRVLIVTEKLIRAGKVNLQLLFLKLNQFESNALDLLKVLTKNCCRLNSEKIPSVAYSWLPLSTLEECDLPSIKDAYHFFHDSFLRPVSNTTWTFLVTPNAKDHYNISFRSIPGGPNVQVLAQLFGGGGHPLSSGGKYPTVENGVQVTAEEVCQKVLEVYEKEKIPLTS